VTLEPRAGLLRSAQIYGCQYARTYASIYTMRSVLLVESDWKSAQFLQEPLTNRGFRVSSAQSGAAASRILAADKPDIVLVDVEISDSPGVDLLSQVQASEPIPIVLMGASPGQAAEAILRGAADYVLKRNQESTLNAVARLARELEDKSWPPSASKGAGDRPTKAIRRLKPSVILVRGLRKWMVLPQDAFAAVLGYKTRSISKWEQGSVIAGHAIRTLEVIDEMRCNLVRQLGWRGSQEWLHSPQVALGGKRPIECIWSRGFGDVLVAAVEATSGPEDSAGASEAELRDMRFGIEQIDQNYRAFLRDQPELEANFPGSVVAYARGNRVAIAQDSKELIKNLPPEYAEEGLFIGDVPETVIKIRRPMRVLQG
jgi:CheY-like chemotaxis protein/DNA-binding transcriptional regulator YiaG